MNVIRYIQQGGRQGIPAMKKCSGGMDGPGGSGQFDLGPGCRSEEGERGTGIRKLNFLNSFGTFSEHEQHDIHHEAKQNFRVWGDN